MIPTLISGTYPNSLSTKPLSPAPVLKPSYLLTALVIICNLAVLGDALASIDSDVKRILPDGSPIVGRVRLGGSNIPVEEYLGIPFAEPPVNELRFRRPVRKKQWTTDYQAEHRPNTCVQTPDVYFGNFSGSMMWNPNTDVSEDCLYLNIWRPVQAVTGSAGPKLTVMVWIYGGGFWSGSSTLDVYDGKIFAGEEDVVLVSMNYRVTAFGFLYIGTEEAPGNVGLWDQLEALKWVKDNIAAFGGDPNDVTIFGESAGGASVSFHILSPESKPYFKRAIMQSGSATAPWALESRKTLTDRFLLLAEGCGCNVTVMDPSPDFEAAIDCMRRVPAEVIREREWITNEFCDFPWTPVIDGTFLTADPISLLRRGQFKRGEILVGSNYDESMYFVVYHVSSIFSKNIFFTESEYITSDKLYREAARQLLPRKFKSNRVIFDAILHEYRDFHIPTTAARRQDAIDKMLGDYHFTCNVNEFADYVQLAGNDVYMYHFTHQSSQLPWPKWMGVLHGYEIPFVFGEPLNKKYNYLESEKPFTKRVMRYWSNFARTGNPNKYPNGSRVNYEWWPLYSATNEEYLTLDAGENQPKAGNGIRRRYCAFWKRYVPKLLTATSKADISKMDFVWQKTHADFEEEYMDEWKREMERYERIHDDVFDSH